MKNSTLKAPAHLRPDTRAWWLHVHSNWRLEAETSTLSLVWGAETAPHRVVVELCVRGRAGRGRHVAETTRTREPH
jgi:hypothetical protein